MAEESLGNYGLIRLNQTRSVKLIGINELPSMVIVTAREEKLHLLGLTNLLHEEEYYSNSVARTRIWNYKGKRLATLITGVGGPSMDRVLVSAISHGAKFIIRVGTAGLVNANDSIGLVVVPKYASGDCVVFKYYHRLLKRSGLLKNPMVTPDPDLLHTIELICQSDEELKTTVRFGPIFSTGLIMHEDEGQIRKYQNLGCVAADMETAPLMAGAAYYGMKSAAIHVGSDHIVNGDHRSKVSHDAFEKGVLRLHKILDGLITMYA